MEFNIWNSKSINPIEMSTVLVIACIYRKLFRVIHFMKVNVSMSRIHNVIEVLTVEFQLMKRVASCLL